MRFFAAIAVLACCLPLPVYAADEGGADYGLPFTAGDRVNRERNPDGLATATVVEWTGADLIALGAETAADALTMVPGCFVGGADRWPERGEKLLYVRGRGPVGVHVLIDGTPMDQGLYGTTALENLPVSQIALLRVYPGPAPLATGVEGGLGVVEIVTRRPGEKFIAGFDARFADHQRNMFSFGLGDTHHWFQYFAMADSQTTAGEPLPAGFERSRNENGGLREGSEFTRNHYRGRVGVVFPQAAEAHCSFFYNKAVRNVPFDAVMPLEEIHRFPEIEQLGGQVQARTVPFGVFSLDADAYLIESSENREDYTGIVYEELRRDHRYRQVRSGGALTPRVDLGPWSLLQLRLSGRHDEVETYLRDQPHQGFITQQAEASLEDTVRPMNWLVVNLGGGGLFLEPTRSDTLEPGDAVTGWQSRAGLAVGPFYGLILRLAGDNRPQAPTIEQWFDAAMGDPELTPGTINNAEAALIYQAPGETTIEIVSFFQNTTDGIELIERPDTEGIVFANEANWQSVGATLTAASRPLAGLYLGAHGTYVSFYDRDLEENVRLLYVPEMSGGFDVRYRFSFGLGGAAQFLAVGERKDFADDREADLEAYSLTNLRLFYSYRDQVEVYVQGRNLFDVAYEAKRFYPESGRLLFGGLKLTY